MQNAISRRDGAGRLGPRTVKLVRATAALSPRKRAAASALLALLLASCGDSPPEPEARTASTLPSLAPGSTATSAPAAGGEGGILPDVTVDDLAGGTVQVSSLAPAERPTLVWFWAPH